MSDSGNGGTLIYRVTMLERELEKAEARLERVQMDTAASIAKIERDVAVLNTSFQAYTKEVKERLAQLEGSVNDDVKGLRKVLISAGVAVLIAALTFAITSLAVFGGPG